VPSGSLEFIAINAIVTLQAFADPLTTPDPAALELVAAVSYFREHLMKRKGPVKTIHAQYVCTFRPEPEGGYTVRSVAFPEIVTHGASLGEARRNVREAIELCLEVYQEKGWPLPPSEVDPRKTVKEMVPVKLARA